ncbi:unnamed protein product, partial [Mesorhabditis spiculigera]
MREPYAALLLIFCCIFTAHGQFDEKQQCFCKQGEAVETCDCVPESLDIFNNEIVYNKLVALLERPFFRYYKVNMDKQCPFWPDDRQCGSKECGIATCDDEVPAGLKRPAVVTTKNNGDKKISGCAPSDSSNSFDPVDRSLSEGERQRHAEWDEHDRADHDKFCEVDDEDSTEMHYVDLLKNPERYTGYGGDGALRIWKSIYQENCFKPDPKFDKNFLANPNNFGLCLEKRVFYRLISGLHSGITISIAAHNYRPAPGGFGPGSWYRNTEMFAGRFGTKWSWEGPQRLRNVYFTFLLELRALIKAAPYLQNELFFTGNEKEDTATRAAVEDLLETVRGYTNHFDEQNMFLGVEAHARELREEFRSHFLNISRIMDCVSCDKCRLWGKVQTHGMGTALKILFSDLPYSHFKSAEPGTEPPFQLTRNEVVSLFQSLGRYSSSIFEVGEFRKVMMPPPTPRKSGGEL